MTIKRFLIALVVLGVVALAIVGPSVIHGPSHVASVTFVNPTPYDLDVDAARVGGASWVGIGTAHAGATNIAEEVVDLGDTWVLRFSYGGQVAGELHRTRPELVEAGWRVEIPPEFVHPLEAAGITPPPPH